MSARVLKLALVLAILAYMVVSVVVDDGPSSGDAYGTGSHASHEARPGLRPSGFDPYRGNFWRPSPISRGKELKTPKGLGANPRGATNG